MQKLMKKLICASWLICLPLQWLGAQESIIIDSVTPPISAEATQYLIGSNFLVAAENIQSKMFLGHLSSATPKDITAFKNGEPT